MMIDKKIYIVEDEEKFLKLYKAILNKVDYITIFMETEGDVGFEMIKKGDPDLIILDNKLPNMDGLTICKELRKIDRFKAIPIIAMSSTPIKGNKEETFLNAGFDKVLEKPINLQEFRELVLSYLN